MIDLSCFPMLKIEIGFIQQNERRETAPQPEAFRVKAMSHRFHVV